MMDNLQSVLPFISSFSNKLLQTDDYSLIANLLCEVISTAGLDDCVIYRAESANKQLTQVAAIGQKLNSKGKIDNPIQLRYGEGIVGMVALFKKSIIIDDTTLTPNYVIDDEHRLSELTVPILYNNEVIGVIDSENEQKDYFNDFHHALFEVLAATAAPVFHHVSGNASPLPQKPLEKRSPFPDATLNASKTNNQRDAFIASLNGLSAKDFTKLITETLKHYHKPVAFNHHPVFENIFSNADDKFALTLFDWLKKQINDACDELFLPTPKTQKLHFIIEHTYFSPLINHQAVADKLGMSYSTFTRHLAKAKKELSDYLWVKLTRPQYSLRAS
ncbi:GAF domain-containing protein [Aliikangiella sp. G2MR2-5]|uniref:GAF domain-containing protein n=1 Tax=Aliikangiella sp. G2MR2-5 TaxID=2788943 RepID=UPI0018ABB6BF|nr:GAF domain-containing protein [Aliikangiella sp. G2MR2-5]